VKHFSVISSLAPVMHGESSATLSAGIRYAGVDGYRWF
jgi:hypothetical protein